VELFGDASVAGDWAWARLELGRDGRIAATGGEGPGVAALLGRAGGLTLLEAAALPATPLAGEALAAAIGDAIAARPHAGRVAVAMSGGVDSAVALLDALDAGLQPVGVTLRLWIDQRGPDAERACCSATAVLAARQLCHGLGVPHVTLDLREAFRRTVVGPFVEGYASGKTPNPCTTCNADLRFDALVAFCDRIGAGRLVTGHYAGIVEHRGRLLVSQPRDALKDQSYMLGRLEPALLERLWFPHAERTKEEVRERARGAGFEVAGARESQEACFLAGADYRDFLERHGLPRRAGAVVDEGGRELGRHDGYWRFTPGQRRGLRIGGEGPLYALRTDPARNAVVVGPRASLARSTVRLRAARVHVPVDRVHVKLRYRSPAVGARVDCEGGNVRLVLDDPCIGVAPGQTAVLYEGRVVVGAGEIASAA
jgi:tRNA-specific 2-thiouridylase